ncbi:MAG: hypothetical protein PVI06_17320 [Desulfobacterales bacterium]|jgi:hypothetical protein
MSDFENLLEKINKMSREIWDMEQTPQEIAALKKNRFVPSGTVPSVLYACFDVANGSSYLIIARDMLKDKGYRIQECNVILAKFLTTMAGRYTTWGFHSIAKHLLAASERVGSVAERDALLRLVNSLLIYNNKLWNWLDMAIPWFELDQKIELR